MIESTPTAITRARVVPTMLRSLRKGAPEPSREALPDDGDARRGYSLVMDQSREIDPRQKPRPVGDLHRVLPGAEAPHVARPEPAAGHIEELEDRRRRIGKREPYEAGARPGIRLQSAQRESR